MAQAGRGMNLTEQLKQRLEELRLRQLRLYGKELSPDDESTLRVAPAISGIEEEIDEVLELAIYLMARKVKQDA